MNLAHAKKDPSIEPSSIAMRRKSPSVCVRSDSRYLLGWYTGMTIVTTTIIRNLLKTTSLSAANHETKKRHVPQTYHMGFDKTCRDSCRLKIYIFLANPMESS